MIESSQLSPHPSPLPSRGREFLTFLQTCKIDARIKQPLPPGEMRMQGMWAGPFGPSPIFDEFVDAGLNQTLRGSQLFPARELRRQA